MRMLKIGDEVVLLLPTEHSKLLMKWKGPHTVMNVSGPVDYRTNVDGEVKIFFCKHMLLKYERRAVPDDGMIAQVGDTIHGCDGVVPVDDADVPPRV